MEGEVVVRAPRRRLAGHDGQLVGRQPVVCPVAAEHLADGAELEREEAVDDHDGDIAQHDPSMPNGLAGCHSSWALLPLAGQRRARHAEYMDAYSTFRAGHR